jgi:nuclear GTP-binding protein
MAPHVKSKRKTLRHKYKVERKVREHHRQVRKANKKKVAGATPKSKRKDPGVPNLWPYKQEILEDIERRRTEAREAKAAARAAGKSEMAALGADAARRAGAFERAEGREDGRTADEAPALAAPAQGSDGSRKAFMREFRRVVDSSDVILEVLDARDPIGCRCFDAERAVMAAGGGSKRVVLVLNKVDLVPREVVEKWLTYLRNEFPTVAFRASIQGGSSGAVGQASVTPLAASTLGTSDCLGAGTLLGLLKNYARSRNMKTSVTVGVIGFPNVGKSSLINSLKRSRAVSTGAMPGVTRNAQEVHLDKNVRLIDCPGIVFSDQNAHALVLRNCIKIDQIADPVTPVEMILKRVGPEPLMAAYALPEFDDLVELLALIAKARGKYRRGGALDVAAAAVVILQDWNGGKIPFYTLPPKGPRRAHISAAVVKEYGREFHLDDVADAADLDQLAVDAKEVRTKDYAAVEALEEEDVEEMEDGVDDDDDDNDNDDNDDDNDDDDVDAEAGEEEDDDEGLEQTYHAGGESRKRRPPTRMQR